MRILLVTPSEGSVHTGNLTTSRRWVGILRELGHEVTLARTGPGPGQNVVSAEADADVLVALHAYKCSGPVLRFRKRHPHRPVVVALTGTDLYRDLEREEAAIRCLEAADRLVALHDRARDAVPARFRPRLVVIHQSVNPADGDEAIPEGSDAPNTFPVAVVAHLRDVKDPLLTAQAARLLPERSLIQILHVGAALTDEWEALARREVLENPRYRWLGERPRGQVQRLLATSRLLSLTSRLEGGANVLSEAVVAGTPVVSSRIPGSVGLLGASYPGYVPVGDASALARCLLRAEEDAVFYRALQEGCRQVLPLFRPEREREAWRRLLASLPSWTGD